VRPGEPKKRMKVLKMHLDFQNIQQIDIFKDLTPEELDQVLAIIHPARVFEGERLIREGDTAQMFYIIISGNYMISFKDGKAFTLHTKGDMIGWSSVASPFTYHESAVALTDGEVLTMPVEEFLHLMQEHSDLGSKITKKVTETVRQRITFIKGTQNDKDET
jgi:CRP-like cAMP-binding protein